MNDLLKTRDLFRLLPSIMLLFLSQTLIGQQYNVAGNAFANGSPGCYTLTNTTGQSGAVWNVNTINLTQPIDITLSLNFGCNDLDNYPDPNCGADGMTFVLQPNGTGSFGSGGGVGFNGLTPSFGVVMDTYENGPDDNITFDNGVDHISINTNGDVLHGSGNELIPPSVAVANGFPPNIEDCNSHVFRFVWTPAPIGGTAQIYFDGVLVITYTGDIVTNIFSGNPVVYWGVSASTGGCWNVQTVCMTVVASFITTGNYCAGSTVNFQDQSVSGTTINSWNWDFGDGTTSSLQNPSHTYDSSGNYQVSLTITNIAGFTSTITQQITILAPIVDVASINPVCAGDNVILQGQADAFPPTVTQLFPFTNTNDFVIPDGGISYGWLGSGGSFANSSIPVVGLTPGWTIESICLNISHTYDGDLIIYLQDPCGNLMLLSNEQGGSGDNFTNTCFSPSATGSITSGFSPYSGTWIPEAGAAAWASMQACATPNGMWNLIIGDVYASDNGSLLDWSITFANDVPVNVAYIWQPINVNNTLTPTFTASTSGWYSLTATDDFGCFASDSVYLTVNPVPLVTAVNDTICPSEQASIVANGASTYVWNTASTTNPLLVSPLITTTYTVTGTSNGCSATAAAQAVVNPGLNISVNSETICEGDQAILNPSGADAYVWNTNATDDPYLVSPTSTTQYSVTGTSLAGCSGSALAIVTVNPNPDVTIDAPPICEGTQGVITGNGANTYLWSTGFVGNPLVQNPMTSTTYMVTGTSLGCTGTATAILVVNPLPVALFSVSTSRGCVPLQVQFTDQSTGLLSNWDWDFGFGATSNDQNPSFTFTEPGIFPVTLSVTTDQGCSDVSDPINIEVLQVIADIIVNGDVYTSGDVVNFFDGSIGADYWYWDFGNETNSLEQNASTQYIDPGEYEVYLGVSNADGCSDTAMVIITVNPLFTIYIPSAFSPNNDGTNDQWFLYGESWKVDDYELYIFDRWGKVVFQSTDINQTWNGLYDGSTDAKQSVYSYRIKVRELNGNVHVYEGTVTLVM